MDRDKIFRISNVYVKHISDSNPWSVSRNEFLSSQFKGVSSGFMLVSSDYNQPPSKDRKEEGEDLRKQEQTMR
jgi:hypothetical protein